MSSEDIAEGSGVSAVQVRKDLSFLGAAGTRGVGYDVTGLADQLVRALGLEARHGVAIIGAGNLGSALANYQGFEARGFRMVAIYDIDSDRIGGRAGPLTVRSIDQMATDARVDDISIGMIATPADAAQFVSALVVEAGVRAILNFAPVELRVPQGVSVRRVDLATELQILSYHLVSKPEE